MTVMKDDESWNIVIDSSITQIQQALMMTFHGCKPWSTVSWSLLSREMMRPENTTSARTASNPHSSYLAELCRTRKCACAQHLSTPYGTS
jgi:hypothetical protein